MAAVKDQSSAQHPRTEASKTSSLNSNVSTSGFVAFWRKVYHPLGFAKAYNYPLFIIFAGAMLGFVLARISYLNIAGSASSSFKNSAAPGEWYWYHSGYRRVGITLHLAGCIPAGFLMIWQFLPVIRHKILIVHRINGYIIVLLIFVSNSGALMIARRSFGGTIATQAGVYFVALVTTISISMAYYNIKRLQIDQHRAWMLRTMFYLGFIITLRLIQDASSAITSISSKYYDTMPCDEIRFIYGGVADQFVTAQYPQCSNSSNAQVVVLADEHTGLPQNIGASKGLSFAMAFWLAFTLHPIGVEIYLALTPKESRRLRQVSYERQLERGYENPGSAGLVVERWGDAEPWIPQASAIDEKLSDRATL